MKCHFGKTGENDKEGNDEVESNLTPIERSQVNTWFVVAFIGSSSSVQGEKKQNQTHACSHVFSTALIFYDFFEVYYPSLGILER